MGFEGEAIGSGWDQSQRRGGGDCFDYPSEVFVALDVDEYLCDVSASITCRKSYALSSSKNRLWNLSKILSARFSSFPSISICQLGLVRGDLRNWTALKTAFFNCLGNRVCSCRISFCSDRKASKYGIDDLPDT